MIVVSWENLRILIIMILFATWIYLLIDYLGNGTD